jgi:hypothetical protein
MFALMLVQFTPSLDRSKLKFPNTPSFDQKYVVASKFAIPLSCHTAHSALVLGGCTASLVAAARLKIFT